MLTRYAAHLARTNKVANYSISEVKSRIQGSRPRIQKKSETKAKDSPSRGQGQQCSRPTPKDTDVSVLRKKGPQKLFSGELRKKTSSKIFFMRSPKEEY